MTKNWITFITLFVLSITSIKFKLDASGLEIALQRTQQQLAVAQNNFNVASALDCDGIKDDMGN